jgi:hypothetical protein
MSADDTISGMIEQVLEEVKPIVMEAEAAQELYEKSPSIKNGSYMQKMEERAKNALQDASNHLWVTWEAEFKEFVTEAEFASLVENAYDISMKQDKGKFWYKYIGNEIGGNKQ